MLLVRSNALFNSWIIVVISGRHFEFVRYIKVVRVDRLVENLCTVWIGRLRLHANIVRFQRPSASTNNKPKVMPVGNQMGSYASMLKMGKIEPTIVDNTMPSLVLDDVCIRETDRNGECVISSEDNLPYPPGFTPMNEGIQLSHNMNSHAKVAEESKINDVEQHINVCSQEVLDKVERDKEDVYSQRAKKRWVKELCSKNRVNFVALQETKKECVDLLTLMSLWGNYAFDYTISPSLGKFGEILCVWESSMFVKENVSVSDSFLAITAIYLDRHLSDHRPTLLKEVHSDYGAIPFRMFNSWFQMDGFDKMVEQTLKSMDIVDPNRLVRLKKKLQLLKQTIRSWIKNEKTTRNMVKLQTRNKLIEIDRVLDQGGTNTDIVKQRMELVKSLNDLESLEAMDITQKANVRWSIEEDENTKFFHGVLNNKRSQLSIRGVLMDGVWVNEPVQVKHAFFSHFADRFNKSKLFRLHLETQFPNVLSMDQVAELERNKLERNVSDEEIKRAGCNSSFIALIPKIQDAKLAKDFRPITLILDGPFILNELISWCKSKKNKAMGFKVDFEKAYNSIRWDYLNDILRGRMSRIQTWDVVVHNLFSRLSRWKLKTLSVGGRLTLLKLVLGSIPLYHMSIFKVPKGVINNMEAIRRKFFNGSDGVNRKIGIDIPSLSCPICDSGVKSLAHLLFACPLAQAVLAKVRRWWGFSSQEFDSYEDWFTWFADFRLCRKTKNVLEEMVPEFGFLINGASL
uniref:RNA-directed DNA polymerase, eukaryota n=1 Tax=Tanacetum cinerariifolium TaxID=118510 RepID=A0A6L2JJW3_TANCI|nr:hypothetical protein [Tanacetum cinerariifolium]